MTELAQIPTAHDATVELTEKVVREHQATVWRYLRFLGCTTDAADDLTQEAFLALHEAHLPDHGSAALRGWLRGTARNLMRERRRKLRRELSTLTHEQVESEWDAYARDDDGENYRAALAACLETLSPRQRAVLDLRYAQRASREEIAKAAGVGPEGAKSILRRIKDALRLCIERRLERDS